MKKDEALAIKTEDSQTLHQWKKQNGYNLPLVLVVKMAGDIAHPNYLNELWNRGEESRDRVKQIIIDAEDKFLAISEVKKLKNCNDSDQLNDILMAVHELIELIKSK